jgi:hypothetical protein
MNEPLASNRELAQIVGNGEQFKQIERMEIQTLHTIKGNFEEAISHLFYTAYNLKNSGFTCPCQQ